MEIGRSVVILSGDIWTWHGVIGLGSGFLKRRQAETYMQGTWAYIWKGVGVYVHSTEKKAFAGQMYMNNVGVKNGEKYNRRNRVR